MSPSIFVFSAPSGTGKSTVLNALMKKLSNLAYSISHTTRPPRGTEQNGVEYHFVTEAEFRNKIDEKGFLEWAQVHGHLYGTAFDSLKAQIAQGLDILMDVDVQGAQNVRKHFSNSVLIFLLPPSLKVLEDRLKNRGTDEPSVILERLEKAGEEIKNCRWYDYLIVNEDLETAVSEAKSIIISERCSIRRQRPRAEVLFPEILGTITSL